MRNFDRYVIRNVWALCAACVLTGIAGCGKSGLSTIRVEGKVTFKGQPVSGGDIAFHPTKLTEGGVNRIGIGRLDAEGNFKMSTVTHGDGVQAGEYAVVITSREGASRLNEPEQKAGKSSIPVSYSSVTTTPLKATISADGPIPRKVDFELTE